MDIRFLHVPKFSNDDKPIDRFSFINLPTIGLLGSADYLRQNHYDARIIHLGVERQVSGAIDLDKIIVEHQPLIVGLSLHWHFQAYDVIETAEKIKQAHPEVAVLLGGFTALLISLKKFCGPSTASISLSEVTPKFHCWSFLPSTVRAEITIRSATLPSGTKKFPL